MLSAYSVWYGAVIRGDVNSVTIGDRVSIGDRAVVHVAKIQGDFPTAIGNDVVIGAGALIHAATLKDACQIGEAAQVLDGATVEAGAMVGAASVVTPGTVVAAGELWAGAPAKRVRPLMEEEKAAILALALETVDLAQLHVIENMKEYTQVVEEEDDEYKQQHMKEPSAFKPSFKDDADVLGQGQPGRIFRSTLSHPYEGWNEEGKSTALKTKE
jgi:carbonic anhydrase/acetyltransferase-like protein (isoleucine patch superfamily)